MSNTDFDPRYYNTVDQIFHAEWAIERLSRIRLLARLIQQRWPAGHPTQFIHVAGTSGKGSTTRLIELGLRTQGNAGAYFSPHVFDYRERFSINGEFAGRADITAAWEDVVLPLLIDLRLDQPHLVLSFPEIAILIALILFERHEVAWAAIETGLGGRYDQTRALKVAATVLTNVGRDHLHLLGEHQWQRALDKAGIIRPGVPLFTTATDDDTRRIVRHLCRAFDAPLTLLDQREVDAFNGLFATSGLRLTARDALLHAPHQRWNATLALHTLQHLFPATPAADMLAQFAQARLLGRDWSPESGLMIDTAHSPEETAALAARYAGQEGQLMLVVGASGKRSAAELYAPLLPLAHTLIITEGFYRARPVDTLFNDIQPYLPAQLLTGDRVFRVAHPREALAEARRLRAPDQLILLTGSTYMIEQALNPDPYLSEINRTFGWRFTARR